MKSSFKDINPAVLTIHQSTVPTCDMVHKVLLDELVRTGKAQIVPDQPLSSGR